MAGPLSAQDFMSFSRPPQRPQGHGVLDMTNPGGVGGDQMSFLQQLFMNPTNAEGQGGGINFDGLSAIASGIGSLGNIYNSFQQNKLARDSFNFTKDSYNTNLANQTQTYNTSLEDRIRSRYNTENRDAGAADEYLAAHKL